MACSLPCPSPEVQHSASMTFKPLSLCGMVERLHPPRSSCSVEFLPSNARKVTLFLRVISFSIFMFEFSPKHILSILSF